MYSYPYAKPSVTATVFAIYNDMLVVGTRSKTSEAFPSKKCFPGGFLNAHHKILDDVLLEGETVLDTAIREFEEECGIELDSEQLVLFHEHSNPETDPRCHVVNLCYIANLRLEQIERLVAGDDLDTLDMIPFADILYDIGRNNNAWAFNHLSLASIAILTYRKGGDYFQRKGFWAY